MVYNPAEPRGKGGKWSGFPLIHKNDLSTPDARRSPEVSKAVFLAHAKRGAARLALHRGQATEPTAMSGPAWDKIIDHSYKVTREPWGGATIDAHTGQEVRPDADAYALTIRPSGSKPIRVAPDASPADFRKAMEQAKSEYHDIFSQPGSHIGVFHDADTKTVDIDPVLVTSSLDDVHDIGAFTHAVGGAYHFKSGDGYWPPHVKG